MSKYNKNSRSFAQAVTSILSEVDADAEIEKVKQEQERLEKEEENKTALQTEESSEEINAEEKKRKYRKY